MKRKSMLLYPVIALSILLFTQCPSTPSGPATWPAVPSTWDGTYTYVTEIGTNTGTDDWSADTLNISGGVIHNTTRDVQLYPDPGRDIAEYSTSSSATEIEYKWSTNDYFVRWKYDTDVSSDVILNFYAGAPHPTTDHIVTFVKN
jgi:hypothetical protein